MSKSNFNKKNFTLIESSLTGMDDTYKYENYVDWCKENEQEPKGKDSEDYWQWVSDQAEIDYDNFFDNLHYAKAEKGFYMITFDLGLWNGHRKGYVENVYTSMTEAIKAALNSSRDYWDYKVAFENGNVVVYGYHHDGTNIMTISQLSKHGERNLLDKDEPNYDKYVQLKDTFKKLDWQFAWT